MEQPTQLGSKETRAWVAVKGRTFTIGTAKLADIMKEHGIPRYCKIDIEGNDLEALASLDSV